MILFAAGHEISSSDASGIPVPPVTTWVFFLNFNEPEMSSNDDDEIVLRFDCFCIELFKKNYVLGRLGWLGLFRFLPSKRVLGEDAPQALSMGKKLRRGWDTQRFFSQPFCRYLASLCLWRHDQDRHVGHRCPVRHVLSTSRQPWCNP